MNDPRIISFLPAATEMVFALGLGDALVGVSHECDFPPAAKMKPVVVKPALPLEKMTLREIDVAVAERIGSGQSLYQVDENLLRALKPDLILTQNLCQVCAPSGNELTVALKLLEPKPQTLWMTPHSIEEIFGNLRELGQATGLIDKAEAFIAERRERLEKISSRTKNISRRPRVFCVEWADPVYCAGHWVPEMVELAGGFDALARKGTDSVRIAWADVLKWAPEILIFSPCGFNLEKALEQVSYLEALPGWDELPAVRSGQVYAVDANSYFARPGPRVVEGTELLAHLFHPELFGWNGSADAFRAVKKSIADKSKTRIKTCPECGSPFACKMGGCWCDKFPPLPPAPGTDCLCPACLAKAIVHHGLRKS
ncbi:MAG TPA: ABC transporter substrate-binding protein [Verrucomicrobiae bacterium]|jgi:iron complex transport system substrate-binding protein